jgi:pilus assembly protein Flp/PilA
MKENFLRIVRNLHNDESGQDLVEYALITGLIALAAVAAIQGLSTQINTAFGVISAQLQKV